MRQQGQATLEYAAIVLVVAVLLLAAGGVAAARGGGVADGVTRQIARALCIVSGGDCDRELAPCVVGSSTWARQTGATLFAVRLGTDRTAIVEERSDGVTLVTYVEEDVLGLEGGSGAGLRIGSAGLSGEAGAAVLARSGDGRVWELRDRRRLPALLERLRRGRWVDVPAPAASFDQSGWSVGLHGAAGARARATLRLDAADLYGSRLDAATGRRTFYVRRANDVVATASLRGAGGSAAGGREEEYAVTVDASGRPVDLAVLRRGRLGGSADLPDLVQPAAGLLSVPTRGERAWVTEAHLDLTDPANAAAASAFLAQVRSPRPRLGAAVDVSRRLAERLARHAVVDARTYALQGDESGVDGHVSVAGLRVRGTWRTDETSARLLAAATRGRDGDWVRRDDCLERA